MADGTSSCTVSASVSTVRRPGKSKDYHGNQTSHSGQGSEVRTNHENRTSKHKCLGCGRKHGYNECPAWRKTCIKCHLKNHFKSCCKTKSISTADNRTQKSDERSESEEEIFIYSVDIETGDEWFAPLSLNGTILPPEDQQGFTSKSTLYEGL